MTEENTVLLVWEIVPEETNIFKVKVSFEELIKLKEHHGKFLNLTDDFEYDYEFITTIIERAEKIYGLEHKEPWTCLGEQFTLIVTGQIL